ncbi:hypothetical protein D3C77_275000 [compost metagenome]
MHEIRVTYYEILRSICSKSFHMQFVPSLGLSPTLAKRPLLPESIHLSEKKSGLFKFIKAPLNLRAYN